MDDDFEKQLEGLIQKGCTWENVPPHIKKKLENSREIWKERVVKYSLKHQLRWKTNLVKTLVTDERSYYLQLLKMSRTNLMLYPYHLSDVLIKNLKISPFKYYVEMMQEVMKNELSFDRIPNFTAADCVRLLGIGRNEFIDIMNKCRASKGWIFKMKKAVIAKEMPNTPVPIFIDYWWIVNVGFVSEEDIKYCNDIEHYTIDSLIDEGPQLAGSLDKQVVKSLYNRGLVFLDVPIDKGDYISVPPLENFVMNRVGGDYFENLLYKIFVSTDERTSVEQLAVMLDIDIEMVKQAVSMYCRLGFAKKKIVEAVDSSKYHPSWTTDINNSLNLRRADLDAGSPAAFSTPLDDGNNGSMKFGGKLTKRIGFVFDYTITALLMMGNLGSGLKTHAVTMYEVGKLADESLDEFLGELAQVKEVAEGEAQRYHDHAISLKNTLLFLRDKQKCQIEGVEGVDLLRSERLITLEASTRERILNQNYGLLISMAPISTESPAITSCIPRHFGPFIPEANSVWFKLYLYECAGSGPNSRLFSKGSRVRSIPTMFQNCEQLLLCPWKSETQILHVNSLLPLLNDHLMDTPCLVQVYSNEEAPQTAFVPFPLDEEEQQEVEVDGKKVYDEKNLASLPCIQKLKETLFIQQSCGYITMLKQEKEGEVCWVPLELHYGIPLGNVRLNQEVCNRIHRHNLFSQSTLDDWSKKSRLLSMRLLDFIAKFENDDWEVDENEIPFPARGLQFARGKLTLPFG